MSSVFVLAFLKWYFGKILVNWKQWMKPNWMNVSLFGYMYNSMVDAIKCVGGLEQWKSYFNFCFQYRISSGEEIHSVPVNSQSGLRIVLSIRIYCSGISWIKLKFPELLQRINLLSHKELNSLSQLMSVTSESLSESSLIQLYPLKSLTIAKVDQKLQIANRDEKRKKKMKILPNLPQKFNNITPNTHRTLSKRFFSPFFNNHYIFSTDFISSLLGLL